MSKQRDVLLALKALVALAVPTAIVRGFDGDTAKPAKLGGHVTIIGHPGVPGEPSVDLSPLVYNYDHRFPLEAAPPSGSLNGDAAIDAAMGAIGAAVAADRTLGGLCFWLEAQAAEREDEGPVGVASIRWAQFAIVATYATSNPL